MRLFGRDIIFDLGGGLIGLKIISTIVIRYDAIITLIIQIIRYSQIISRTPMIQIIHAPLQSNLIINSRPRINSRAYYSVYIAENRPNFKR